MEEKAKELSIVAVISILTIVLAISVGVAQASEWQETHPNASSGTLYEHVSGMVGEGSKVSNVSPDRDSKVIYGQNLSATIPKQVVLTEQHNGSSISVYKGQELVIELNSNPSTGYRWEVVESNENILRFMGMEFGEPETNLFGAPQKQIIRFEVNDTGVCSPKLVYKRPWEQTPEDYYIIRVNSSLPPAHNQHTQHTLEKTKAKAKGGLTASTNRSEYSARLARLELTKEGPKAYIGPEARIKPVKQTKEKFQNTRSWSTIMTEDFEGDFPGEKWDVFYNETEPLPATWGKTTWRKHSGEYSAYCAGSILDDNFSYPYPPNMSAWMVYGPFNLSDARDAELFFNHWTRAEGILDDYLFVGASVDGIAFYGVTYSGHWNEHCGGNGWCPGNFDLTDVYTLGNLCGYKKVWIAFAFISNSDGFHDEGVYLDDIVLRKDTGEICPGLPSRFDWRDSGGVTPIKDQGGWGGGGAFAKEGQLEA
ncbi:MAG: protease inhibitor I42 family protein, partial [Candidatus Desulfofervidus sp.]|nr:protease inhibitor I42 family protein [Candidatus Desulfofervidus sp.]